MTRTKDMALENIMNPMILYLYEKGKIPDPCIDCELNDGKEHTCHGKCWDEFHYRKGGYNGIS